MNCRARRSQRPAREQRCRPRKAKLVAAQRMRMLRTRLAHVVAVTRWKAIAMTQTPVLLRCELCSQATKMHAIGLGMYDH